MTMDQPQQVSPELNDCSASPTSIDVLLEKLQRTQDELQQALRRRDEVMSVVSHELRTPLNTLKLELYTRRLHLECGNYDFFSPERLSAMLDSDERQLNQLVRLINDMSDASRIRSGQLTMQPTSTDLVELTQRLVDQFSRQLQTAMSQAVVHAEDQSVIAQVDELHIEQALANLLTNAIRHCAAKPVDIFIRRYRDNDVEWASVAVRDYGKGVEPADRERIFGLFERGSSERKGAGLGLGLFIARQVVLAHGGKLSIDAVDGAGALFTMKLPIEAKMK